MVVRIECYVIKISYIVVTVTNSLHIMLCELDSQVDTCAFGLLYCYVLSSSTEKSARDEILPWDGTHQKCLYCNFVVTYGFLFTLQTFIISSHQTLLFKSLEHHLIQANKIYFLFSWLLGRLSCNKFFVVEDFVRQMLDHWVSFHPANFGKWLQH